MNYFKNKKQIVMAMLLTLSVLSSASYASNNECFPAGQAFFLDVTNQSSWYDDNLYPYAYMFGSNKNNIWIKLQKYGGDDNKYFKWTVPNNNFSGLVFALNGVDVEEFNTNTKQSTNITYNKTSNFYQFEDAYDNGKIKGKWICIDYPQATKLYLDVTNVKDWENPHVYMWNKNANNTGLTPMTQENIGGGVTPKYFSIDVPSDKNYHGLIFAKHSTFDGNNNQTVDIMYDNHSNCYTLHSKGINGKRIGEWSNNAQISGNNEEEDIVCIVKDGFTSIQIDGITNYVTTAITDTIAELTKNIVTNELENFKTKVEENKNKENKKEVIEALLNEYAKQLGYSNNKINVTKSDDGFTFKTNTFTVNDIAYNIEYFDPNITITKSEESSPIFTINTSKENPEIIKNTISEIQTKVEENKENEMKDLVKNLFNVFDFNIIGLYNNILDEQFENIKSINDFFKTTLICEGTAKWNWEDCATTFTITSLKYNTTNKLIPDDNPIIIKKDYSDDANAKNDITESDVLVKLLKNNKLFYIDKTNGKKYVFNSVDFSGMKYFAYLGKYIIDSDGLENILYCLKCALNSIKDGYWNAVYEYKTDKLYNYNNEEFNIDETNFCMKPGHFAVNKYDELDNYKIQINFLDKQAGGCQHRVRDKYESTRDHELCAKNDLKNGWKNQS